MCVLYVYMFVFVCVWHTCVYFPMHTCLHNRCAAAYEVYVGDMSCEDGHVHESRPQPRSRPAAVHGLQYVLVIAA